MPHLIPRAQAVEALRAARGGEPCLICGLRDGRLEAHPLHREGGCTVLLNRYPVRWGHLLVLVDRHVTRFSELSEGEWGVASALARRGAAALERALAPARCYVGAFGTAREGLEMSAPHLHLHVVPTYEADERPSAVLTWKKGVWAGSQDEWAELEAKVRQAW